MFNFEITFRLEGQTGYQTIKALDENEAAAKFGDNHEGEIINVELDTDQFYY